MPTPNPQKISNVWFSFLLHINPPDTSLHMNKKKNKTEEGILTCSINDSFPARPLDSALVNDTSLFRLLLGSVVCVFERRRKKIAFFHLIGLIERVSFDWFFLTVDFARTHPICSESTQRYIRERERGGGSSVGKILMSCFPIYSMLKQKTTT